MVKFLSNLSEDQHLALQRKAEQTGESMGQHVRNALDLYFGSGTPCGLVMSGSIVSGFVIAMRGSYDSR